MLVAQLLKPFQSNHKWGYTNEKGIIIKAQYDTAFAFDKMNQIALVGNKSEFNKTVNPLTGEEKPEFIFFYINAQDKKIKLKDENFPDSISSFPDQLELYQNYLDDQNQFKILFQNKVFLFSKSGKQISTGFDDIYLTKLPQFYYTENYSEVDGKPVRILGLIDTSGNIIAKNKYHEIKINGEDSVIYCCSAVFSSKLSDDVLNYNGKQVYSNKKHIEFSSKNIHVMKEYEPVERFLIENEATKKTYTVDGTQFLYLKENKAVVVNGKDWILVDLPTGKEKKFKKENATEVLGSLLE